MSPLFYELEGATMRYDGRPVLLDVSVSFSPAQMVSIVGPNGAGKSTLLGIMTGLRPGFEGRCRFQGKDLSSWTRKDFAREVSFVPQNLRLEFPFAAEEVVLMGRTPYCDGLFEAPEDHAAVERAMRLTDSLAFRRRDFRTLSGGERQRVVLASALAQDPKVLLLDEPTTFLDLRHQVQTYSLLRSLCREGLLVVTVTHDLNLAAAFSDRLLVLAKGRLVADAPPAGVISSERIRDVFEVDVHVVPGPDGRPRIFYGS